jgi:hypothetical protein
MLDPADEPEDEGYELVVPFVVCTSVGGPFDDDAFVAGFQAGQVNQALKVAANANAHEVQFTINAALVKQVELIGMNHGFHHIVAEVADDAPSWAFVTFRTGAPVSSD